MKILVAEDSRYYRKILEETLLGWEYEVVLAKDGLEALGILCGPDRPQIAVLDWVMPGVSGLEVCQTVRFQNMKSYIYMILLTGMGKKENIIAGLEAGADDYIVKPFNDMELKYRIKIGERIINLENSIMQLALVDSLTGLLNRRAFMERLESEVARCKRLKQPLTLIMIDIDNFKSFNDIYGHLAGDAVLVEFAAELSRQVRKYDFIGRYGGEEFIVCMPATPLELVMPVAERLRKATERLVVNVDSIAGPLRITASFGVSSLDYLSGENINTFLKKADSALYLAKVQGKNKVCSVV